MSRCAGLCMLTCLGRGARGTSPLLVLHELRINRCRVSSTIHSQRISDTHGTNWNKPNTCSGYQSAFVRLLVCTRSSMARLCSFCFSPSMRTTSQLSPLTEYLHQPKISVYFLEELRNHPHHRHVTHSSRGLARNSLRVSFVSSCFSIRSAEKSTTVICD